MDQIFKTFSLHIVNCIFHDLNYSHASLDACQYAGHTARVNNNLLAVLLVLEILVQSAFTAYYSITLCAYLSAVFSGLATKLEQVNEEPLFFFSSDCFDESLTL